MSIFLCLNSGNHDEDTGRGYFIRRCTYILLQDETHHGLPVITDMDVSSTKNEDSAKITAGYGVLC